MRTRARLLGAHATFVIVAAVALAAPEPTRAAEPVADESALASRHLKAIRYVENAHSQLEEFTDRLLARLERGLGARPSDPILDGRAELQTAKIRVTYAGYVKQDELAALFRELSAAHARRLELLQGGAVRKSPRYEHAPVRDSTDGSADAPVNPLAGASAVSVTPAAAPVTLSPEYRAVDARIDHLIDLVRNWRPTR